jgi:polyhydroxyalkanoate synthase subunit PhaE
MNPFESMQSLAMLWGKAGDQAFADGPMADLQVMAERFGGTQGMGDGGPLPMPDPNFETVRQAFVQSWSTARELSETLTKVIHGGKSGTPTDDAAAAMLAKIFDPRGWLSVTNELDEALQRMAEGPRLSDLWNTERKLAAVFTNWVALRRRSLEHNAVVLEGWTRAAGEFAKVLNERAERGEAPLQSVRELLTLWGDTANRVFLEMQRSEAFLSTQRELLRASTDLRLAQRAVAEFYSEMFGYPTRAELDDVHKAVTEMRRELRALKRSSVTGSQDQPGAGSPARRRASGRKTAAATKRKEPRA